MKNSSQNAWHRGGGGGRIGRRAWECGVLLLGLGLSFVRLAPAAAAASNGGGAAVAVAAPEATAEEIFVRANTAFEAERYQEAAALYQALIDRGHANGWIYFNLGNSLLRAGSLGPAIAAYLQAEALLPRSDDVQANLNFARQSTKDALEPWRPPALLSTLFFWHYKLSKTELGQLFIVVSALFWLAHLVLLYRSAAEWLRWSRAALLCVLVALAASLVVRWLAPRRLGVATSAEVPIHSGTSRDTVVRFAVHEGTQMQIIDQQEGWVRIRLSDGKQGWAAQEDLAVLRL